MRHSNSPQLFYILLILLPAIALQGQTITLPDPLNGEETVEGGTVFLEDSLTITGRLVLGPGTVVKGKSASTVIRIDGGELLAQGTADNPVVFTSWLDTSAGSDVRAAGETEPPEPGDWGAIINRSTDDATGFLHLQYTEIRYGAGSPIAAVLLESPDSLIENCQFTHQRQFGLSMEPAAAAKDSRHVIIRHSHFGNNQGGGIRVLSESSDSPDQPAVVLRPRIAFCSFQNNQPADVLLWETSYPDFEENTSLPSTIGLRGVALTREWNADGTLESAGPGMPFLLLDEWWSWSIRGNAAVTVAEGAVFKSNDKHGGLVVDGGHLVVAGSPDHPVLFTSIHDDTAQGDTAGDGDATEPAPGDWGNIEVKRPAESEGSLTLRSATLRYGGYSDNGLIETRNPHVTLQAVTLEKSTANGLYVYRDAYANAPAGLPAITGCTIARNAQTGLFLASPNDNALRPLIEDSTFRANEGFAIAMRDNTFPAFSNNTATAGEAEEGYPAVGIFGTITATGENQLGPAGPDFPYVLTRDLAVESSLHLLPGTVIKGQRGDSIEINGGKLTVSGDPDAPVVFTSFKDDTVAGDTNLDGSLSQPGSNDWEGIILNAHEGKAPSANIACSEIRYSGWPGNLHIIAGSATVERSRFLHANGFGVNLGSEAAKASFTYCSFRGNEEGGMQNQSGQLVEATHCFWDHPDGPHDPSAANDRAQQAGYTFLNDNPNAQSISDNIHYDDWLSEPVSFQPYLWEKATAHDKHWRHSSWFGWFQDQAFPVIRHEAHGYLFCHGDSTESILLCDLQLRSWFWTSLRLYPWFYQLTGSRSGWLRYQSGRSPNRSFLLYASGQWLTRSEEALAPDSHGEQGNREDG